MQVILAENLHYQISTIVIVGIGITEIKTLLIGLKKPQIMQEDNTMPSLHSPTHYQAAQANAQTQAWQRVCLSNRTTKTYDKQTDEKEHRSDNSVYVAIAGEVVNRRFVLLINFVLNGKESASNPLLHIHAKRYKQA